MVLVGRQTPPPSLLQLIYTLEQSKYSLFSIFEVQKITLKLSPKIRWPIYRKSFWKRPSGGHFVLSYWEDISQSGWRTYCTKHTRPHSSNVSCNLTWAKNALTVNLLLIPSCTVLIVLISSWIHLQAFLVTFKSFTWVTAQTRYVSAHTFYLNLVLSLSSPFFSNIFQCVSPLISENVLSWCVSLWLSSLPSLFPPLLHCSVFSEARLLCLCSWQANSFYSFFSWVF